MAVEDQLDLVEIACFECGRAFGVCVRDYRGQRYCGRRCGQLGYRSRAREAGRRYQGTPDGRARHWLRTHYQRLIARGKPPKLAIVASMGKLLTAIYSVAKSRRPFVPIAAREA